MTGTVGLHPQHPLEPGRYRLDADGRLHPERYAGFIRAVAIVHVKCRPVALIDVEPVVVNTQDAEKPASPATKPTPHSPAMGRLKPGPKPKVATPSAARPTPAPARQRTEIKSKADGLALFGKIASRVTETASPVARRIEKRPETVDPQRYAAAYERERALKAKAKATKLPPMVRAASPEACSICGASGRNGCDHFLPFVGG